MNRRKFFAGIAAVVTAACVPGERVVDLSHVKIAFPSLFDRKGPGYIAARYGRGLREHSWWRPNVGVTAWPQDFGKLEARTLASLQATWKECLAYKSGDTLIVDEQAYEVFKTSQE